MKLLSLIKFYLTKIGQIQSQIIMGLVYFLIIGPMAILFQLFHRQKHWGKTYWVKKEAIADMNFYLSKQF